MNYSEFKKLLGADPYNQEPETLLARKSGPEFEQAATEAEAFERKIEAAVAVNPPGPEFLEEILALPQRDEKQQQRPWMAMAASVIMLLSVAGLVWNQSRQPGSIDEYIAMHYGHDGERVLALASDSFELAQAREVMARFDMSASADLEKIIRFMKVCPTREGKGAHMIVQTESGPVSIIIMPEATTEDHMVELGEMQAYLVSLNQGSAAIIGRRDQAVAVTGEMLRNALTIST